MEIKTGRVDSKNEDKLDITIKSAQEEMGRLLAPTWDMVMGYKRGLISEGEYRDQYIALLRERYAANRIAFERYVRNTQSVTLCCYCRKGAFCHRYIAADVLMKVAAYFGVEAHFEVES